MNCFIDEHRGHRSLSQIVSSPSSPIRLLVKHVPPPPGWAARPRPVRMLTRPLSVAVIALLPDGPPARVARQRVVRAEGPERIGGEWWAEDAPEEDYWRVETETGARLWIARREGAWSVRGYFP